MGILGQTEADGSCTYPVARLRNPSNILFARDASRLVACAACCYKIHMYVHWYRLHANTCLYMPIHANTCQYIPIHANTCRMLHPIYTSPEPLSGWSHEFWVPRLVRSLIRSGHVNRRQTSLTGQISSWIL